MTALPFKRNQSLMLHKLYIEQQYARCYNATIRCDYDDLIVVKDHRNQPLAAAGFRGAQFAGKTQHLFLEDYLEHSIETLVSQQYHTPVVRQELAEIGNFVATNSKAAFVLMQQLWSCLRRHGYLYALLTCTEMLRRRFRGLPVNVLGPALASNIAQPRQWGSYYRHNPQVMVGRLSDYDQRFQRIVPRANWRVSYVCKAGEFDV